MIKFLYSEKAAEFCEIFPLLLTVCTVVKSKGNILQNFVAYSEYMNFIIEVSADCLFFLVRPWRILWKAEKEKVVVDEIKRIEKELAKCQDYEIPELGIKIGYNPIWCMMDGKEKYVSTYLIFCSLMGFFFLNNLPGPIKKSS